MSDAPPPRRSLRRVVLDATGQDMRHCHQCALCDLRLAEQADIGVATMVQLILDDDDEILTSRLVWSDQVLAGARELCARSLNLQPVLLALRAEAARRGLTP